jgi:hypothetical protein
MPELPYEKSHRGFTLGRWMVLKYEEEKQN